MDHKALAALMETLSGHVDLSKSRLETLCLLIVAMVGARTVNLSHLASEIPSTAQIASTYRRLQRFFQHVELGDDWSAALIVRLLGLTGPWYLCLDRTNWKIGRRDVNLLVLAIATRRFRVPVMWTVLDKAGNSNTAERIALMRRYLAVFEAATVNLLLADREFIGARWMTFLNENNIPFAIRVKETQTVMTEGGHLVSLKSLLRKCRGARRFQASIPGRDGNDALPLSFAARRIKDNELLIVASNAPARNALNAYRKRWAIECLFGDAKTRGLNLEDTRLSIAGKLSLLLALVALAIAWVSKTASAVIGRRKVKRKKHGYPAKSWFRIGFDQVRRLLQTDPINAIRPWLNIAAFTPRVV